jgi:hypothetical protein
LFFSKNFEPFKKICKLSLDISNQGKVSSLNEPARMTEAAQEDFSQLPLTDRLVHKVLELPLKFHCIIAQDQKIHGCDEIQSWKARLGAYEELQKKFQLMDQEAEFSKFTDFLKAMLMDSNQAAQETGFNAVNAFLSNAPMNLWCVLRI